MESEIWITFNYANLGFVNPKMFTARFETKT